MAPKGKDAKASKVAPAKGKAKDAPVDAKGAKLAAQSVNVRHILCEKHSRKEDALAALSSGRSFDDVAREFSEDKANRGGGLGWQMKNSLLPEFSKAAFELETSTTAKPKYAEVKTSEGYHILMVEGRK